MKYYLVSILILFFMFCSEQKTLSPSKWEKIGTAIVKNSENKDAGLILPMKVEMGIPYNIIHTEKQGSIHLKHRYLDSLDIKKTGDGDFRASFWRARGSSIEISNLKVNGKTASADFIINKGPLSFPRNSVQITLVNHKFPKNKIELIKSCFLPVIHDYLAEFNSHALFNSCIENAIKGCGQGNVDYVDIGILGHGCSFKCK